MAMTLEVVCRHEFVTIFQRRLKGCDRRMVATKAYLPVGFKMGDLNHLGEGSYSFCSKCRTRLYPRRTNAEKAAARIALAQSKLLAAENEANEENAIETAADVALEPEIAVVNISVEELEVESPDLQDIEAEGVKLCDVEDEPCALDGLADS